MAVRITISVLKYIEKAVRRDKTVSQPIMIAFERYNCVTVYRDSFRTDITVLQSKRWLLELI